MPKQGLGEVRSELQQWVTELTRALETLQALSTSQHRFIRGMAQQRYKSTQAKMETLLFFLSQDTVASCDLAQLYHEIPIYIRDAWHLTQEDEDRTIYRQIERAVQGSAFPSTKHMDIQQVRAHYTGLRNELQEGEEATAYTMLLEELSCCHIPSQAVLSLYNRCLQLIAAGRAKRLLKTKTLAICIDFIDQHDPYPREKPSEQRQALSASALAE